MGNPSLLKALEISLGAKKFGSQEISLFSYLLFNFVFKSQRQKCCTHQSERRDADQPSVQWNIRRLSLIVQLCSFLWLYNCVPFMILQLFLFLIVQLFFLWLPGSPEEEQACVQLCGACQCWNFTRRIFSPSLSHSLSLSLSLVE